MADARIEIHGSDKTGPAFASVNKGLNKLEDSAGNALKGIQNLAIGVGVIGFASLADGLLESAAGLDDMRNKTGATVEGLSQLTDRARIVGASTNDVEEALLKLNLALRGTKEQQDRASAALNALGLSADDLRGRLPDEALKIVAKRMAQFGDSAGKTTAAIDIFGKSGAQLLALLNDIGTDIDRTASLTGEQASAAEDAANAIRELRVELENAGRTIAVSFAPTLTKLIDQFSQGIKIAGGFWNAIRLFGIQSGPGSPLETIKDIRKEIEKVNEWKFLNFGLQTKEQKLSDLQKRLQFAQLLYAQQIAETNAASYSNEGNRPLYLDYKGAENSKKKDKKKDKKNGVGRSAAAKAGPTVDILEFPPFPDLQTSLNSPESLAAEAAFQSYKKRQEELARVLESGPNAQLEKQRQVMIDLAKAYELGQIDLAQYTDAAQGYLGSVAESGVEKFNQLQQAIEGWGRSSAKAIVDFAFTGKTSFSDMVQSMLRDLAELVVYKGVTEKIASAITSSSFVSGIGAFFGFHSGGIVGQDGSPRTAPIGLLAGAKRYHSGLAPDEFPAILQRGEGVFTKPQMRAMGGTNYNVSISVDASGNASLQSPAQSRAFAKRMEGAVKAVLVEEKRPGGLLSAA